MCPWPLRSCGPSEIIGGRFDCFLKRVIEGHTQGMPVQAEADLRFRVGGDQWVASSSFVRVHVAHQERKTARDAGFHGDRYAPWSRCGLLVCSVSVLASVATLSRIRGMDEEVHGSGYRGDGTRPHRRVSTGRLGLQTYDRFVLSRLLHLGLLSVLVPPDLPYEHEPSGGPAHHSIAVFLAGFCPRGGRAPGASEWFRDARSG